MARLPRRWFLVGALGVVAGLTGCSFVLDLEPPARMIGIDGDVTDGGTDGPSAGDAADVPSDAAPPDVAFVDAGPDRVVVSDLRGIGGTHDGTVWEGRALRLEDGRTAGSFTSQVFSVETPVRWTRLRWWPWLAYGRPLPDGQTRDHGYPGGDVDMAANVLLLHLDEVRPLEGIADGSGQGHTPQGVGDGISVGRGIFGGALGLTESAYLAVDADDPAFRFGINDFTWGLFVRTPGCPGPNNAVLMGGEAAQLQLGTHMWLGCQVGGICTGAEGLGGTLRGTEGPTMNLCAETSHADGRWHHVALVKQGHTPSVAVWYIDGREVLRSDPVDFGAARFDLAADLPFTIGGFPRPGYATEGAYDEVAIWHRALSREELERIATRGLGRLSVQVRACVTSDCSDDPPFGPDLIDDFVGDDDVAEQVIALGPSQHLQYRVNLTGQSGLSPRLLRVELEGEPAR